MTTRRSRAALTTTLFALAIGLVWLSIIWGRRLQKRMPEIKLGAAPFVGRDQRDGWDWRAHWQLAIPIVIACVVVFAAPHVITRWRLRWVALATGLTAGAFAVALAFGDGSDGLFHGATDKTEYYANLSQTREWRSFLSTFVDRLPYYSVHVRGHPPGFTLVLKAIAAIGLHGAWPVVTLSIIGVVTTPIAVLIAVHRLAGSSWARRAAPFLVVTPYAIWQITSADAFYTAVTSASVAMFAVALTAPRWQAGAASLAGGLLIGLSLFFTYGAVTFLIVLGAVVGSSWRRKRRIAMVIALSSIAALAVLFAYRSFGFWWFDGASALRKQYWAGTAKFRTWTYFALSNVAVLLVAVGPAVLAGVGRLRVRGLWILCGAALVAITASEVSQYSKGEVERIWLLFYPWVMLGAAPLATAGAAPLATTDAAPLATTDGLDGPGVATLRVWLVIQAAVAIVLQSWLVSKW